MVKYELTEALDVSSLCLMLKSVYDTLRNVENKGLQPNFEQGVKEVMRAIDRLKDSCDTYLEDFIINYKEIEDIKHLKCKNCGCGIKLHSKHIEYNNLYFCDEVCFNSYMSGKWFV